MASLTGNKIKDSYLGLLKSIDNIDFVPRAAGVFVQISDGDGNGLPLYLSTAGIRFHNAYTFPSSTGTVGQVLSADAAGDLVFSNQLDNQTLEQVLSNGNTANTAILSTASGNTFGSTTFNGIATLANASKVLGTPPTANNNSTNIATTAYVDNQVLTGGTVKKTGTISQNAIAVWNNASDTLRSDPTLNIYEGDNNVPNHSLYLYQPNGATPPVNLYSYNIGGGHLDDVTGVRNTGFGYNNLVEVLTGQQNTAFGAESLKSCTVGSFNSAFGEGSLISLTTGNHNTAFGWRSLAQNTVKSGNTAFGAQTLSNLNGTFLSTYSINNVAIGETALFTCTTSAFNVAVGHTSLYFLTTGDANTALGYNSGSAMTTGSKNVIIGSFTGFRAAVSGGLPVYDIKTSSNNIVLSDGDGNVRQSFDSNGDATFGGTATFSGNVKVNKVNPLIFADSTSTNKASGIITSESGTNKWGIGTNFGSSDNSFNIYNYAAEIRYLTISSGGNVLIGTGSPAAKLHIVSSSNTDGLRLNAGTSVSNFAIIANNQANSGTLFYVNGIGNSFFSGNVGIGKSPSTFKLDLETASGGNGLKITRGSADFQVFQVTNGATSIGTGNSATLNLITSGSSKMSISSLGQTTINSSIADATLKINGTNNYSWLQTQLNGVNKWAIGNVTAPSSDTLEFYSSVGTAGTRLSITSGGVVSIPNGIVFNNNTTGGTPNATGVTLNDYEEGTFTPFFNNDGTGSDLGSNYTRMGKYTRIGNMVYYIIDMSANISNTTGSFCSIGGLPFTSKTGTSYPVATFRDCTALTISSGNILSFWVNENVSYIYIQSVSLTSNASGTVNNWSSTGRVNITGMYRV